MEKRDILVGITNGDINGIGYEVIIKSLLDGRVAEMCTPVVYGSPKVAAYHRKALNIENFSFNNIRNPGEAHPRKANMINCLDDEVRVELGKPTQHAGEAALRSLEAAVKDLRDGKIDVLVTAPVDKSTIQSDSFRFPGHTEYLKSEFGADDVLMLMISENMKIGTVTGHIPIAGVPSAITAGKIVTKLRILNNSLKADFTIRKPRIALLGLNPHAGDNGLLGNEEKETIIPAAEMASKEGILVFGPFAADGFFGTGEFRKYDAILAMYHDQGLIPFKALAFDSGVNYTAGLPVVRTSPAHGTAFQIAGLGQASESSFRHAIYRACDIFRHRQMNRDLAANPLERQHIDTRHERPDELPPDIANHENII
ncbi:MAG: 4-hydroxythreonine-4-phosphate dehydrogenase PdxA [Bacteroidetes bacterium]|nr:4-hydroxythreonine-4-phosphate dehydrogenase PdxA [Bacteroidota bacterium]